MVTGTVGLIIKAAFQGKGFQEIDKQLDEINKKAKLTTNAMNNALGGKKIENSTKSLATNLGAVGNRLGFMAFQWKFMAGAAQQALQSVIGLLQDVLRVGGEIQDKVGRALAFGTEIQGLAAQSDKARKELEGLQDAIVGLGSGKTIFNRGEISEVALELQKAFDDVDVTKNVLPFATLLKQIDPNVDNEKLGTGLVTLFEALDVDPGNFEEVAKAMDFLSNVSDKSTLNFQSSIASLSKAAQTAKVIGLEATELGTVLQIAGDVLGANKSSGRAGAQAGRFSNAFFEDLKRIADENTKQGQFARDVGLEIFDETEQGVVFKNLINEADETGDDIVTIFKKHFGRLESGDQAAAFSQLGLSVNSQKIILALMGKTNEELADMRAELKENNTLQVRAEASVASTGSQLQRFTAAIDSVKASLAAGLAPILKELSDSIAKFTSDKEFNKFLATIGIIIGDIIRPTLQKVIKLFKIFFNIFKKNKKLLTVVVTAVVGLVAALAGLFILSTIAFMVTVAGASMVTMGAQAGIAAGGVGALGFASLGTAIKFIPLLFIIGGLAVLAGVLTGVFDDELIPIMVGLGAASIALGANILIPKGSLQILGKTALRLGSTLGGLAGLTILGPNGLDGAKTSFVGFGNVLGQIKDKAKNLGTSFKNLFKSSTVFASPFKAAEAKQLGIPVGNNFKQGVINGMSGLKNNFTNVLRALAKGPGLIAIAAVGITLVAVLMKNINDSIDKDPFWKTGLADRWQLAGFKLKVAFGKTIRAIAGAFTEFFNFLGEGLGNIVSKFTEAGAALVEAFKAGNVEEFAKALGKLASLTLGGGLVLELSDAVFDGPGVLLDQAKHELELFKKQFKETGITPTLIQCIRRRSRIS
jgi:hypothetical protein